MAMCEKENSNSNELGKDCTHFEVDKDDEYVCTLDELESKLQALKEETQDAKEVASKILGVPEFDEKFIEQFAKDLMIPKEYLKRIKRSMTKYKGIVKWNGNHYWSGEEVIGSKIKFENGKMYLYDDEPINVFPYYGEARNQWVEIESFEKIED